jgi:hypothetical protein
MTRLVFWSISRTGSYVLGQCLNCVPEHITELDYMFRNNDSMVFQNISELEHMFRDNASIVSQSISQNWIICSGTLTQFCSRAYMDHNVPEQCLNCVPEHITELDHIVPEQWLNGVLEFTLTETPTVVGLQLSAIHQAKNEKEMRVLTTNSYFTFSAAKRKRNAQAITPAHVDRMALNEGYRCEIFKAARVYGCVVLWCR